MTFNPANPPAWVSGSATNDGSVRKFHRAVELLRKEGKDITEEAVKELYIKWGGLVLDKEDQEAEAVFVARKRKKAEDAE